MVYRKSRRVVRSIEAGKINELGVTGIIRVDGLPVAGGTSGAPLVSQNGIVGMIVTDQGVFTEVIPLNFIEATFRKWNYPWNLAAMKLSQPPIGAATIPPAESCITRKTADDMFDSAELARNNGAGELAGAKYSTAAISYQACADEVDISHKAYYVFRQAESLAYAGEAEKTFARTLNGAFAKMGLDRARLDFITASKLFASVATDQEYGRDAQSWVDRVTTDQKNL